MTTSRHHSNRPNSQRRNTARGTPHLPAITCQRLAQRESVRRMVNSRHLRTSSHRAPARERADPDRGCADQASARQPKTAVIRGPGDRPGKRCPSAQNGDVSHVPATAGLAELPDHRHAGAYLQPISWSNNEAPLMMISARLRVSRTGPQPDALPGAVEPVRPVEVVVHGLDAQVAGGVRSGGRADGGLQPGCGVADRLCRVGGADDASACSRSFSVSGPQPMPSASKHAGATSSRSETCSSGHPAAGQPWVARTYLLIQRGALAHQLTQICKVRGDLAGKPGVAVPARRVSRRGE